MMLLIGGVKSFVIFLQDRLENDGVAAARSSGASGRMLLLQYLMRLQLRTVMLRLLLLLLLTFERFSPSWLIFVIWMLILVL